MTTAPQKKYICIHGHFYQPPRENAWLETIESQPSAAPFHDWNERINSECYAPNAAARVLNDKQKITALSNNYGRISYNFGPTLLSWLEENDPGTYQSIILADVESRERFGGHGSAVAQVYNHLIMPLANARDRYTQIRWGIEDFQRRFGRRPEGMWLAETAVDTATLIDLSEQGILYTILAPRQAKAIRHLNNKQWEAVHEGNLNTRRVYRCELPNGKSIDLFFYNGEVSKAVAFEGLLNDGRFLADRLMNAFDHNSEETQLTHIATDGESYGHHHKKGEMAMAACLNHIEENPSFELTNYGQFREMFPATYACQIHDNSSWSCVHGVERWRSNCGCHTGGEAGWNQHWRGPLRDALDFVRGKAIEVFEQKAAGLFTDPWAARDQFIEIILDRDPARVRDFLKGYHPAGQVTDAEETQMLRLLEMQRHAMLMYTSCGWFFNEVSGIETLQILQYALRALHLVQVLTGENHEPSFTQLLEATPSNVHPNAAVAYRDHVRPARQGLKRVAMHFAAACLFEDEPESIQLFTYQGKGEYFTRLRAGSQRLAIGKIKIRNSLTFSSSTFAFVVLYLGQQNLIGYLTNEELDTDFPMVVEDLSQRFRQSELAYLLHGMRKYFGEESFSIYHLFHDEKAEILRMIAKQSLDRASQDFSDIYYDNYQLMSSMQENNLQLPEAYRSTIGFTLLRRTNEVLSDLGLDLRRMSRIKADYLYWNHQWPVNAKAQLEKLAEEKVLRELKGLLSDGNQQQAFLQLLYFLNETNLQPNLWKSQNELINVLKDQQLTFGDDPVTQEILQLLNISPQAFVGVTV